MDGSNGIIFDTFSATQRRSDATFEMWLKPGTLSEGNYYLFETGGDGRGITLWYEVDSSGNHFVNVDIQPVSDTDNASKIDLRYDVTSLKSDFFHVAFTMEVDNSNGVAKLFVNGDLKASHIGPLAEWSGGNQSGIGCMNSSVSVTGDYTGFSDFIGEIATFNYYDSVIDNSQIDALYATAERTIPISLPATGLNATNPPGASVSSLFENYFGDSDSENITGIAISGDASGVNGTWQYSTDLGDNWYSIGSVSTNSALLLSSSSLIRFLPANGFVGTAGELTIHAVDSTESDFTLGLVTETTNTTALTDISSVSDSTVTLNTTINATNTAPEANDDDLAVNANIVLTGSVFSNNGNGEDADKVDGDSISVTQVNGVPSDVGTQITLASGALLTLNSDGSFSYDPNDVWDDLKAAETANDSFTYQITDANGEVATATVNITINGVNEIPEISAPTSLSVSEDGSITLGSVSISDVDAGITSLTLTIAATNGDLQGVGSSAATISLTGTIAEINNALNSLSYTPNNNFNGSASLQLSLNDNDPVSPQTVTGSIAVDVTPVNDAPVLVLPTDQILPEDGAIQLSGISISDVDGGNVSVSLSVANGALIFGNLSDVTISVGANFTSNITLVGTVANLNSALTDMFYQGNSNFNGLDSLSVSVDDLGNGGSSSLTASGSVDITVTPVNDAPVLALPSTQVTAEGASLVINGISITDIDANEVLGAELTVSLSVTDGVLEFADLSQLTILSGSNGSSTLTLQGTLGDLNSTISSLTYSSFKDFNGTDILFVSVNDLGNNGGTALTDSGSVQINVSPIADTPSLSVVEISGTQGQTQVLDITASAGSANETLSIIIVGLPQGSELSAGVQEGASWVLNETDLIGLTLTLPDDFADTFDAQVTALSIDGSSIATVTEVLSVLIDSSFVVPNQPDLSNQNDQASITGVNIAAVNVAGDFNSNSLNFLQGGTSLQFEQSFLSDDALNVIADLFNLNTAVDTEVADGGIIDQSVKNMKVYDLSPLTEGEQSFILDLIQNVEQDKLEDSVEEEEEDAIYNIESAALKELTMKTIMEDTITQDYLDTRTSLDDTYSTGRV